MAAVLAPSAGAAAFAALELRVVASPARAAEACRRGALDAALPHLLEETPAGVPEDADVASTRDAAIELLAALVAATPQAAAAALGLASCRGCATTRRTMVFAALCFYGPHDHAPVPEDARRLAAALVRLCCDAAVRESTGDAAARLALALLATPRRHVRDAVVASLTVEGMLRSAFAALRVAAGQADDEATDGEESVALRRAARLARLLAQFVVVAVPRSAKMFYTLLGAHELDKHSTRAIVWDLLCRICREPEIGLLEACAAALAASRAPPLLALAGDCGWAAAPRSARATLSICCSALLAAVVPYHGDDSTRAAMELALHPGAFAGLVAGVHALVFVRGHVLCPLPLLLTDTPSPDYGINWKLSTFTFTLVSAVTTRAADAGFNDGPHLFLLSDQALSRERGSRHAGFSYALLAAAMQPYYEESHDFDNLSTAPIRLHHSVRHFVPFASMHFPQPLQEQHPTPPSPPTLGHPMTLQAAYAAVATVLHRPLRSRSHLLPFGAHEIASLALASLLPTREKAAATFALRCVVHMLGRALRTGSSRDDALTAWLLRRSAETGYSAQNADPGTRLFVAARRFEQRGIRRVILHMARQGLLRLAWVRAAERGDPPDVAALDTADQRAVVAQMGYLYRETLSQLEVLARERASLRRSDNARLIRTAVRAAAALHALRVVQGEGTPALWQHAAFVPHSAEPALRAALMPYKNCYFAPPVAAARAAEATKAAKAAADTASAQEGSVLRRIVAPPPPTPAVQDQTCVALLVGDVAFDDVPVSWLATSPLLADLLELHAASGGGAPLHLCLSADVPPGTEGATFALLLSCLAAVAEDAQADVAAAAAAKQAGIPSSSSLASVRRFVLPPQLQAHWNAGFDPARFSPTPCMPCDPPPHRPVDTALLLPAWSSARQLQLDAVTDALGDALTEWLSRQAWGSAAWVAARDALAASPADEELEHALMRADIRALARNHAALLAGAGGERAAHEDFAAWHERSCSAAFTSAVKNNGLRFGEDVCRWASALGRAMHAEAALLLPTEAWYARKITLARRAVRQPVIS